MLKTIRSLLFAVAVFLLSGSDVWAQVADFRTEEQYLLEQKDRYQRWLDHTGTGKILRVHSLYIDSANVALLLGFNRSGDTDYAVNAWETLKNSFEKEHPLSLEQALFYKWINLSGISSEANVGVYVYATYTPGESKLFGREIYFDSDSGRVVVTEENPRAETRKIEITPPTFAGKKISEAQIREQWTKEVVYEKIFAYAEKRFSKTKCEQRFPEVVRDPDEEVLIFTVTDLCREVLTDETDHTLCEIFRMLNISDCNWVKREVLTFTVSHEETVSGIRISVEIEGKYGSGFYSNRSGLGGGFRDMEEEFEEYLFKYANRFTTDLKKALFP